MSRTGTSVLGRNADEIDWRQVWLTTAMIDSGKFEPSKIARYKMQPRKELFDAAVAQASSHERGPGSQMRARGRFAPWFPAMAKGPQAHHQLRERT